MNYIILLTYSQLGSSVFSKGQILDYLLRAQTFPYPIPVLYSPFSSIMDPETPANPRYNLRPRKRKPEPPEPTSGVATTVYARRPTKRPRGLTKVRGRKPVGARTGGESSAAPARAPAPAGEVKMQIQRRELPKERVVTWEHDGSLIEDAKFLPEGWDANEYDLYEK